MCYLLVVDLMPPAVSFSPWHSCASFPLCQNSQVQTRSGPDGGRQRYDYCASCLSSRSICIVPDCTRRAAPSTGRYSTDLCVLHYQDPMNTDRRQWTLCCNSRIGCRHLSQTPRSGKCFACQANHVPCVHSITGCSAHVRSTATPLSQRPSCVPARVGKCRFDPANSSTCSTPFCGQQCASLTSRLCSDCTFGRFPCPRRCSRRCDPTIPTTANVCALCAASASSESSSVIPSAPAPTATASEASDTPSVCHIPKHCCLNFPFCRKSQKIVRATRANGHGFDRREQFCGSCMRSMGRGHVCSHSGCSYPAAPSHAGKTSNGFCSFHVKDPAHGSIRAWPLCRNVQDSSFLFLDGPSSRTPLALACGPRALSLSRGKRVQAHTTKRK